MGRTNDCIAAILAVGLFAAFNVGEAAASLIDPDSIVGDGQMTLDDSLALPPDSTNQQLAFGPGSLGTGSASLDTEDAGTNFEWSLVDATAVGGDAVLELSAAGGGGEMSSASSSLTLAFTTTDDMLFSFSPNFGQMPQHGASADFNGMSVEAFHDPLAVDLVGGNYFTDDWPANGYLPAGDHLFNLSFDGAGYRGAPWGYDASATLELTSLPEPSSAALLAVAAIALGRRHSRRMSSSRST